MGPNLPEHNRCNNLMTDNLMADVDADGPAAMMIRMPEFLRGITKRVKAMDLRFSDPEEEKLFKTGLESDLLRLMLQGSLAACVVTLFNSLITAVSEGLFATGHDLFDLSDVRNQVFLAQLGLWTLAPAVTGCLIAMRVFSERLTSWDWEVVSSALMIYGSVVIVIGQLYNLTVLFGAEPSDIWKIQVSYTAEAWVLLGLNVMTTVAEFFLPLRSIMSWTVPSVGILAYSIFQLQRDASDSSAAFEVVVKILLLTILSFQAWRASVRVEKHMRREWWNLRELEKASVQIGEQQVAIQLKGQEVLEKETKVQETMNLVKSLQTVAKALCDTMVHLTSDLEIRDTENAAAFFEKEVEGELFYTLLNTNDQIRFTACLSRAAQSHVPVCLPVTLNKQYTSCEVHLILVHRGGTDLCYLIGIRVDKDNPYALTIADVDETSEGGRSGGSARRRAERNNLHQMAPDNTNVPPGCVPDKNFNGVMPGRIGSVDEDLESDFSFTTYPKNGVPRPPKFTNYRSRARTIRMILKRWNVPRDSESCCQYHTVLESIDEAVDCLRQQKCDPLWSTYGEQCPKCSCMNQGKKCVVCGYLPDGQRQAGKAQPSALT